VGASDRPGEIAVLAVHVDHLRGGVADVAMTLPEHALAQLRALQEQMLAVGDIWWMPETLAQYPGGKDRFCLLVALERPPGGSGAVVHFVAGSRNRSKANTIKVDSGSCGLKEDTYFRFWREASIAGGTLVGSGKLRGSLPAARLPEIEAAIRASKLVELKRLLP
jgi:hypothetical protein